MSTAPKRKSTLTHRHRAALWKRVGDLAAVARMDKEEAELVMRRHILHVSGQESMRSLSAKQVGEVGALLDQSIRAAKREVPPPRPAAERETTRDGRALTEDGDALVTREASRSLLALARTLGMDRNALRGWIRGRMQSVCGGRPWPQTRAEASALHEGLEAMLFRRAESQPTQVLARARACLATPSLSGWERRFLWDLVKRMQKAGAEVESKNPRGWTFRSWKQLTKLHEIEQSHGVRS